MREGHARALVPRRPTRQEIRRIWPPLIRNKPTVRQASISLLAGLLGDLVAGLLLASVSDPVTGTLFLVPGLITLLPAANALRGNIYAPLGSRLGTYLHTGLLRPRLERSRVFDENILTATSQSLVMSFLLSAMSFAVATAIGLPIVGLEVLVFIAVVSAVIAGVLLSLAAMVFSVTAFKRGLDPDNLNAPLITAGGDLLTVVLLVVLAQFLLTVNFTAYLVWPVDLAAVAVTALLLARTLSSRRPTARAIFRQSLPVLVATVSLELIAGLTLEANLENLAELAVFIVLIPPFIADGGNLASIHSSRLSSAVHLGITKPARRPDAFAMSDIADMAFVGVLIFPAIGLCVYVVSVGAGLPHPGFELTMLVSFLSGLIVTAIVLPLGYYTTLLSFRVGVDPDNVVIPITNSVVDVVGIFVLLSMIDLVSRFFPAGV